MKYKTVKILASLLVCLLFITVCVACDKKAPTNENNEIMANGIVASKTNAVMVVGDSFTLDYTFSPADTTNQAVEFESDSDVVTVSNKGLITANKVGECEVTVKQKDGDKFAKCKIAVANIIVSANAQTPIQGETGQGNDDTNNQNQNSENGNEESTTGGGNENDDTTGGGNENTNQQTDTDTNYEEKSIKFNGIALSVTPILPVSSTDSNENSNQQQPSKNSTYIGGKMGQNLFTTIQEGIAAAKDGDCVLVLAGKYDEGVRITKSINLWGVDNPEVRATEIFNDCEVTISGFTLASNQYPAGTSARVVIKSGAKVTIKNCILTTNSTDELSGGYAIYADKQVQKIEITDNTISNFRYGIYISSTDGDVTITKNTLSNLNVGIGLDIRQENSDSNYPTKGEIKSNTYNEVVQHTQFLHYGDQYNGDFDFDDNEQENAATDQGQTGGSGLTE